MGKETASEAEAMRSARTTSIGYITPADTMQPAEIGASVRKADCLGGEEADMRSGMLG